MSPMAVAKPRAATPPRLAAKQPAGTGTPAQVSGNGTFERDAVMILGELQQAVTALLDAVPGELRTVVDVEKAFGIDHKLGWQLYRIVRARSPLAAGACIPARVSMERLLKAAARRRLPADLLARVSEAFAGCERLVSDHAGDRATLEVMLGAYLPEAREKQELAGKEMAFRGMAQIRGVVFELEFKTHLWHPNRDHGNLGDAAHLSGEMGIRRMRPSAHLEFGSGDFSHSTGGVFTLEGRPPEEPNSILLPEFCSSPLPTFESRRIEDENHFFIPGNDLGLRSSVDLVTAECRPGLIRRFKGPDGRTLTGMVFTIDVPTKRLVCDFFLHPEVFPNIVPKVAIYDTAVRGRLTSPEDPKRERDRLDMDEMIVPIAGGLTHARMPRVPRYVELLEHVCAKLGWSPADFRGYRLDVQYPVYGAAYVFAFDLPEPPGAG